MTQGYSQEWFVEMANQIKARDHAKQMVNRWEAKVTDAEKAIAELSNGTASQPEPEQAQE